MRFTNLNKTIVIFIALSIAIHLCLFWVLLLNGDLKFSSKHSIRMKISLQSFSEMANEGGDIQDTSVIVKQGQTKKIDVEPPNPLKAEAQETTANHTGGWGVGKSPKNLQNASVSEQSALESRIHMERQQRISMISGNIAQLMGRLNQESTALSCALILSQDAKNGYLKCNPEQIKERIRFELLPSNIHWVNNQTELEPTSVCIPILIRNASQVC